MTSANDTPSGDFDERLAQALDAALVDGEQMVAQETGDQGQAIALTKSRILVVKAGFAATGELDGHKVTAFDLDKVTSVNLRKGPLGAVIQVCAEGGAGAAPGGTPDNVVVFTGPGRVKKAEAFAAQVEFLSGKEVKRIPTGRATTPSAHEEEAPAPSDEAQAEVVQNAEAPAKDSVSQSAEAPLPEAPPAPKGGRKPRSLAEEIYSEVVEAQKDVSPQDLSARADAQPHADTNAAPAPTPEPPAAEEEKAPAPGSQYNPNPRLPKPMRRQKKGPSGVLVLLGVTAALVLIGMAIMAPVRQAQNSPDVVLDTTKSTSMKMAASQLKAVVDYQKQIAPMVAKADAEAASMRGAARSGNSAAAKAIGQSPKTDMVLSDVTAIDAPPGLAEAKDDLTGGILAQKTAIAAAAAAAQTGSIPVKETLTRLDEASAQIRKGMSAIAKAQSQLEKQVSQPASPKAR